LTKNATSQEDQMLKWLSLLWLWKVQLSFFCCEGGGGRRGEFSFLVLMIFYFNILKFQNFLIIFLSFWGSLIFLCEVSQGGKKGICFSSCEL
jgi:hypothetical protein